MRKITKLIALLITVTALTVMFAGCSSSEHNRQDLEQKPTQEQEFTESTQNTTDIVSDNTEENKEDSDSSSNAVRPTASIELPISIDIWDYINSDDEWDFYAMAEAIGWSNVTTDFPNHDPRAAKDYYVNDDHSGTTILQIWQPTNKTDRLYIDEYTVTSITLSGHGKISGIAFRSFGTERYYKIIDKDVDLQVPLELIIATAYIMENYEDNPSNFISKSFTSKIGNVEMDSVITVSCN